MFVMLLKVTILHLCQEIKLGGLLSNSFFLFIFWGFKVAHFDTGELGYDGLDGTRKIGPSYAKSVVYI